MSHAAQTGRRAGAAGLLALCALAAGACGRGGRSLDLIAIADQAQDPSVAGRGWKWIVHQVGKPIRINDVARTTLPASPPSRYRFVLDVPPGARFSFAAGIPSERHGSPGVEFVVRVRKGGREEVLWSQLVDPASRPQHRRWLRADVDLSRHAGRGVELILETRGFEQGDHARAAFWGNPAVTAEDAAAPLAVIYLVDTLRADHTGPYGYTRDTTPELDAFAKDAVVFETAVAQSSWTKPSIASLMTSLLPGRHRAVQLRDPLDLGHVTLAEMLASKGIGSGAAIANSVIYLPGTNFDQGFATFAGLHGAQNRPSKIVDAAGVVDAALDVLDSRRGLPTFLYVHTMDPHVPYTPPAPWDRKYQPYATPDHPATDPRTDYKEPLDRERMLARYDAEIAYGDAEFGRFVRELKQRGLYERALLVFMGDHGEEFLDHGKWLHGRSVFDELIRIPLVVKFPQRRNAGLRVPQQVQEVDVLPTLLQELGLPVPAPPAISGQPLQAVVRGDAPEPPAVSEISHRGFVAHGMRTRSDKYVQRFSPEEDELYFDLRRDPREQASRVAENSERVRLLRAGVEAAMAPNPYRHTLKFLGTGAWDLKLRTGGWIEGVEALGLGAGEGYEVQGNGRKLALRVRPRPGQPREVAFGVRPMGAPVWLEGARDGRQLRTQDVYIAREAVHPGAVPFRLPEVEGASDKEDDPLLAVFTPPALDAPGLHLWLTPLQGRQAVEISQDDCEKFKALGYVASCGGPAPR